MIKIAIVLFGAYLLIINLIKQVRLGAMPVWVPICVLILIILFVVLITIRYWRDLIRSGEPQAMTFGRKAVVMAFVVSATSVFCLLSYIFYSSFYGAGIRQGSWLEIAVPISVIVLFATSAAGDYIIKE